jgi:hypothetical protein
MKKHYSTFIASAVTAGALFTSFANAQQQTGGQGIVTSGKVSLSKGTYSTFAFSKATGVTSTVPTSTTSGTIATMNVTGSGLIATVTTTVTGTLDKKTIVKGKVGNKELLQLILNTTNPSDLKGQSLVWVSEKGGLLGATPMAAVIPKIGAANLKSTSVTVSLRDVDDGNTLGIQNAFGNTDFLTSVTASKKATNEVSATGYGYAGLSAVASIGTYSKSLIAGVTNLKFTISSDGTYKETYSQNQTNGVITNSSKGTLSAKPTFGFTSKPPTP